MYSLLPNPFTRPTFWGRKHELSIIYNYLSSTPPQCCALIGENTFGRTSLLRYLADPHVAASVEEQNIKQHFTFIYLDCISYIGLASLEDSASARFWWDLYSASLAKLQGKLPSLFDLPTDSDQSQLDRAFELKSALEDLIRQQTERPVIFLFDNFEGVAHLPLRDSEWLRSLVQYPCAYVVASRHLLYQLYQHRKGSWDRPSPLWNLFQDPIYLGLLAENEVHGFFLHASQQARNAGCIWDAKDIDLLREIAGRHPGLLRSSCSRLFQQRQQPNWLLKTNEKEVLELSIYKDAYPTCSLIWQGLADPEYWEIPRETVQSDQKLLPLSPYQNALINLAHGQKITDTKLLFVLEQRGLIEQANEGWRLFSASMLHFVLEQESKEAEREPLLPHSLTSARDLAVSPKDPDPFNRILDERLILVQNASQQKNPAVRSNLPPLTHLEDKVYTYLQSHIGQVCDREEIKQAVWERDENLPGNSALQKIIERIREKIEPDPDNPHYLIAVRGRGYLLREKTSKI